MLRSRESLNFNTVSVPNADRSRSFYLILHVTVWKVCGKPKTARGSMRLLVGYNLGQKVLRILHILAHKTPIPRIWYPYGLFSRPTLVKVVQSGSKLIQPDFNIVFSEEGGVFIVAPVFQSFILKPNMVTFIFLNIFVQDCRLWAYCTKAKLARVPLTWVNIILFYVFRIT